MKQNTDTCIICGMVETQLHLLCDCDYVKHVWDVVGTILMGNLSGNDVALGERCDNDKYQIITLIKFVIYREWLLFSLKGKERQFRGIIDKFRNDLL
jgi:hypothetical protein